MPEESINSCKDIAQQLIDDHPGADLNVVLGGGRANFIPESEFDPKGTLVDGKLVPVNGNRKDKRNLIKEWIDKRRGSGLYPTEYAYVNSTQTLKSQNLSKLKYLFGLFNHSHMEYEQLRDKKPDGEPSLTEMTAAAIRVLMNNPDGFVLLVEGGRIDHAHHDGYANLALYETVEFDRAIRKAREMLPMEDTLILVTADHSHTMTINGYPKRGNPIYGLAAEDSAGIPFTTLMYTNGPGYRNEQQRQNIFHENTSKLIRDLGVFRLDQW